MFSLYKQELSVCGCVAFISESCVPLDGCSLDWSVWDFFWVLEILENVELFLGKGCVLCDGAMDYVYDGVVCGVVCICNRSMRELRQRVSFCPILRPSFLVPTGSVQLAVTGVGV